MSSAITGRAGAGRSMPPCLFSVRRLRCWEPLAHLSGFAHRYTAGEPFLMSAFPGLFRMLEAVRFPGVPPANICLHPMAMAAWAGLLATAINLLPVGQLDGGHIVYAVLGERGHRLVSWSVVILLALAGLLYWPWWIWALALLFFRRHPLIHDSEPIGRRRKLVSVSAILLLLLSFSLVPVRAG